MTTRKGCTYLPVTDRLLLLQTAISIVDDDALRLYNHAVENGVDPEDDTLLRDLDAAREMAYVGLLYNMTIAGDIDDRRTLVRLMALDAEQAGN